MDSHAGQRVLRIGFPNVFTLGEACDAMRSFGVGGAGHWVRPRLSGGCSDVEPICYEGSTRRYETK